MYVGAARHRRDDVRVVLAAEALVLEGGAVVDRCVKVLGGGPIEQPDKGNEHGRRHTPRQQECHRTDGVPNIQVSCIHTIVVLDIGYRCRNRARYDTNEQQITNRYDFEINKNMGMPGDGEQNLFGTIY